jgi:hypothetical protein
MCAEDHLDNLFGVRIVEYVGLDLRCGVWLSSTAIFRVAIRRAFLGEEMSHIVDNVLGVLTVL